MKVIIRTDASTMIGSGHVMRCLTVAENLRKKGCDVKFWMLPLQGNLIRYIEQRGFINIQQAEEADMYIIDHYEIDSKWETKIRSFANKIMVIDDLANRKHNCDILLDQNFVPNFESRYDDKVPSHCKKLLGPKYLILRDEFFKALKNITFPKTPVQNLLVFMGGTDPTAETLKVIQALNGTAIPHVNIVVGESNPHKNEIKQISLQNGYNFHCQIDYLAELIAKADFGIGAGGMSMWERNFLQLPSTATIVADNQKITTEYAATKGFVYNLGWHEDVSQETYKTIITILERSELVYNHLNFLTHIEPNLWLDRIFPKMEN